jgi:hypothetical protein
MAFFPIFLWIFLISLVLYVLSLYLWRSYAINTKPSVETGVPFMWSWNYLGIVTSFFGRDKSKDSEHSLLVRLVYFFLLLLILSGILAVATYWLKI